jgi:hypothetical protein
MNKLIDVLSEYLAHNKAMPVFLGVLLVALNYVFQFLPAWPVLGVLAHSNLLLHLGVIVGLLGMLIGDAL